MTPDLRDALVTGHLPTSVGIKKTPGYAQTPYPVPSVTSVPLSSHSRVHHPGNRVVQLSHGYHSTNLNTIPAHEAAKQGSGCAERYGCRQRLYARVGSAPVSTSASRTLMPQMVGVGRVGSVFRKDKTVSEVPVMVRYTVVSRVICSDVGGPVTSSPRCNGNGTCWLVR